MQRLARISALALPGLGVIAALILALQLVVDAGLVNRALMPPPVAIGGALWHLVATGEFLPPLMDTLRRFFAGYFIGCVTGIGFGLLMGRSQALFELFEPLVELLRPIPKAALVPALILFLGIGDGMKIASVALVVFFPVLINTIQGVRGIERVLLDTGRTFGHSQRRILFHIILPSTLPFILAGMRTSLGLGLILAILSEMLAGTGGLGYVVIDLQRSFRVREMYAWIVILAALGYALNRLFAVIERRLLFWQKQGN